MKFDEFGCLVSEACDYPGNIGDSCAETSRFAILSNLGIPIATEPASKYKLEPFRSIDGYLRHPTAPDGPPVSLTSWRESDFSGDQATPLLMAFDLNLYPRANEMRSRLKSNFKTGNGNLVPPGLLALMFDFRSLLAFTLLIQSLLFLLPYRWSDSTKWFERTSGSSADYLNWFICLVYLHLLGSRTLSKFVRATVSKEILVQKISSYYLYGSEPNSQWLIDIYVQAINIIYS